MKTKQSNRHEIEHHLFESRSSDRFRDASISQDTFSCRRGPRRFRSGRLAGTLDLGRNFCVLRNLSFSRSCQNGRSRNTVSFPT
jgi:hypothetical protein